MDNLLKAESINNTTNKKKSVFDIFGLQGLEKLYASNEEYIYNKEESDIVRNSLYSLCEKYNIEEVWVDFNEPFSRTHHDGTIYVVTSFSNPKYISTCLMYSVFGPIYYIIDEDKLDRCNLSISYIDNINDYNKYINKDLINIFKRDE